MTNKRKPPEVKLEWIPVQTDDAEHRIRAFYKLLAEMLVKQAASPKKKESG